MLLSKNYQRRSSFILPCIVALILTLLFNTSFSKTDAYAQEVTTTTQPTETTTTLPDIDTDLPGATTLPPSQPTKEQTKAQENAKRANSKLDKATKKLLDAQLAADQTSLEIQTTRATLADLKTKIQKNEALIAIREMPLENLSNLIKKRAVVLYQQSAGKPTSAIEQFYYNRGVTLAGTAQQANFTDFEFYDAQQSGLKNLKKTLDKQKSDAEIKEVQLMALSAEFTKQLEDAKKEYEKTAVVFLDANLKIGARLAIDGKMCPIAGPMTHVDDWGNPRSGGRTHKGNDLFAAMGVPNVAIVDGTITQANAGLGGQGVFLSGIDGNVYYYAHLSAFAGPPRAVRQGEVIGYTGDTGNAKGGAPHTHFEIRVGGTQHINPYPIIRIICGV